MLDQMQVLSHVPFISTLLEHPDFVDGLRDGKDAFHEMFAEDEEKVWTEDDIIALVQRELSEQLYRRGVKLAQLVNIPPLSYLHHLGFTLSYIDQALLSSTEQH